MSNFYDDAKFGVIQRKWFGLTKKYGGDVAAGYTLGAEAATKTTQLASHYPRGPIKVLKVGAFVLATLTSTATTVDRQPCHFRKNSTRAKTWYVARNSAPHSIASAGGSPLATIKAGDLVGFETGTPETDKATDVTTGTMAGTVAFFYDWVPAFMVKSDGSDLNKWDT